MRRHEVVVLAVFLAVTSILSFGVAEAQESDGIEVTAEEFEAKLGYQTGTVKLEGEMATIELPDSFRFLGSEGSKRLLTEAWGNPPESAEGVLGMLIPASLSPLSEEGWGIVITYEKEGYVNDDDAAKIDYAKLLKQMQKETLKYNKVREKEGYETIELVGWAEPPSYDAGNHKVYWAKDLVFGSQAEHTLNYSIRILGRHGVLVLNAIAGMDQLPSIRSEAQNVLAAVEFNEGHRYADYLPGKDKAAAYGIAGLIAGAAAVKVGFFKMLLLGLLAFKKALIAAVVVALAFVKRVWDGKKKQQPAT